MGPEPQADPLTMYTTTWCGYCHRLKKQLDAAGIAFREVDVERDPHAAAFVEHVNGGTARRRRTPHWRRSASASDPRRHLPADTVPGGTRLPTVHFRAEGAHAGAPSARKYTRGRRRRAR